MELQAIYRPGKFNFFNGDWFVSICKTGVIIARELTEEEAGELITI